MYINLKDAAERNYHNISSDYAAKLLSENMTVRYDEESELYTIYNADGNDVEELTAEEIGEK